MAGNSKPTNCEGAQPGNVSLGLLYKHRKRFTSEKVCRVRKVFVVFLIVDYDSFIAATGRHLLEIDKIPTRN